MSSALANTFAVRLRQAISEDPRSIEAVSRHSGYSEGYLGHVMQQRKRNPTLAFVEVMALTLQRDPAWLLGLGDTDDTVQGH